MVVLLLWLMHQACRIHCYWTDGGGGVGVGAVCREFVAFFSKQCIRNKCKMAIIVINMMRVMSYRIWARVMLILPTHGKVSIR